MLPKNGRVHFKRGMHPSIIKRACMNVEEPRTKGQIMVLGAFQHVIFSINPYPLCGLTLWLPVSAINLYTQARKSSTTFGTKCDDEKALMTYLSCEG